MITMVTGVNLGPISVKYHTAGQGPLQNREAGDLAFSVYISFFFFLCSDLEGGKFKG